MPATQTTPYHRDTTQSLIASKLAPTRAKPVGARLPASGVVQEPHPSDIFAIALTNPIQLIHLTDTHNRRPAP